MGRVAWGMVVLVMAAGVASSYAPPVKPPPEEPLPPPTQADWQKSINNLKRIGVAVHDYLDTNGIFPADITDRKGKSLLSWRVTILPYLEHRGVYDKLKLDEAWDGPTNKPLLEKMPTIYAPVRVKGKPGQTFYQGFDGLGTMFGPTNRKLTARHIFDGLSNTCLVVESGTMVEWTKPGDLPFDPDKDLPWLGGHFDGDFAMLLCDGSVVKVKKDFEARTMKSIITRDGGEVFALDGVKK